MSLGWCAGKPRPRRDTPALLGSPAPSGCPAGTRQCFEVALGYMSGFGAPFSLITGNHGARRRGSTHLGPVCRGTLAVWHGGTLRTWHCSASWRPPALCNRGTPALCCDWVLTCTTSMQPRPRRRAPLSRGVVFQAAACSWLPARGMLPWPLTHPSTRLPALGSQTWRATSLTATRTTWRPGARCLASGTTGAGPHRGRTARCCHARRPRGQERGSCPLFPAP